MAGGGPRVVRIQRCMIVRLRWPGRKRLVCPALRVVARLVSVAHPPPGSVEPDGKAGKAGEDEAKPLRLAECYRPVGDPEDAR